MKSALISKFAIGHTSSGWHGFRGIVTADDRGPCESSSAQIAIFAGRNTAHKWRVPLLYNYYSSMLSKVINSRECDTSHFAPRKGCCVLLV